MSLIQSNVLSSLRAPAGKLLVTRLEMPIQRGRIIIPDGINTTTRASEAVVICAGEGSFAYPWVEGDVVFLAPSVSRHFEVDGGMTVWVVSEGEILAKVLDQNQLPQLSLHESPEHWMQETGALEVGRADVETGTVVEGDRRGLR